MAVLTAFSLPGERYHVTGLVKRSWSFQMFPHFPPCSPFFCTCMCVELACIHAHLRVCGLPGCMHVCAHMYGEQSRLTWVSSSITLYLINWGRVSHLNEDLADSSTVASQLVPGKPYLCLLSPGLLVGCHTYPAFVWVLRSKLGFLYLNSKHYTHGATSSAPEFYIFYVLRSLDQQEMSFRE